MMRSGIIVGSIVRPNVITNTSPDPALRRVFAHSFTVVPVVKTSSIRRMRFFTIASGCRTANARRRFFRRLLRDSVVWAGVGMARIKFVYATGISRRTSDVIGKKEGLIEFSLTESLNVQGHRHDHINGIEWRESGDHEGGQWSRQ